MHLYSSLLCIVVHLKHFPIVWRVSPQPSPVCSTHLDDATAATRQRCQCAHHTPATGGEERESLSQSSGWGLLGGHDWQGPVVGIWPGHRDYTLLFTRSAMGFLMTTESQDLGLMSHPKDVWCEQYYTPEQMTLMQRWPTSVLESHSPADFYSNPNQTNPNKLIKN